MKANVAFLKQFTQVVQLSSRREIVLQGEKGLDENISGSPLAAPSLMQPFSV